MSPLDKQNSASSADPQGKEKALKQSSFMVHESYEDRKIQLNQQGRIIPAFKHSLLKVPMNRVDRKGKEIIPGQKYQLTYADQVEKKPLAQVHCVESYKKYNAEEPAQGETPCCTIF